ncbi:MAG TPA: hypothetical protein VE076_13710, partial [Nitrososphaeraceae archaeon]|nr:hypothetical protein [Nitrososphaeraceae archaeon]
TFVSKSNLLNNILLADGKACIFLLFLVHKKRDHNTATTFLLDVLLKIIFSLSLFYIDHIRSLD